MQLTCPNCRCKYPAEAAVDGDAGSEFMALLATMQPQLASPLLRYLGFFRPATQQLAWSRALRLTQEVVQLCMMVEPLEQALIETNRALDEKRLQPGWKPLANHNYLKRVLEGAEARFVAPVADASARDARSPAPAPRSKGGQALVTLEGMKRGG